MDLTELNGAPVSWHMISEFGRPPDPDPTSPTPDPEPFELSDPSRDSWRRGTPRTLLVRPVPGATPTPPPPLAAAPMLWRGTRG